MKLVLPSPAKLNLFLYITGKRDDGYHQLQTLFQFLDYSDTLTFIPRLDGKIRLLTPIETVSASQNLILRAANLLKNKTHSTLGVDISIQKKLPIGGGLGGGSSNAATTLIALNYLWKLKWSKTALANLSLNLGADLPIFIYGKSAFAEGIGERFSAVTPPEKWYLIAHPGIHISTEDIFSDPELPRATPKKNLTEALTLPYSNDCEIIVKKRFQVVDNLLNWLVNYAPARLTGTGACVFAEFSTEKTARTVLAKLPKGISGFVARGVNVSPLYHALPMLKPMDE